VIPSTTGAVVAFFLFVAPGLLFDLLAARRRVGVPETAFREASRVVLASTAFTLLAGVVLGAAGLALSPVRRWLSQWLTGRAVIDPTQPVVLVMLVAVALVACALAWGTHWHLSKGGSPLRQTSAWSQVFRSDAPPGSAPYVRVKTISGSTYMGFLGSYTPNLEADGRELVLVPPLWSAPPGEPSGPVHGWSRIVLQGDQIAVLMVEYRPDPSPSEANLR
jgi:hypothetical protein